MPNIFTHTGYQLSEEDRLTNALACLLEQADREVLETFLLLVGLDEEKVRENDLARVTLQPAFSNSRPDATLHLTHTDVVIETKRGEHLDDDQLRAHWTHLVEESRRPSILLGLTGRQLSPSIVRQLDEASPPHLRVAHVSWSDWLAAVRVLKERFDSESATGFLLAQFESYLVALGYWCFQGDVLEQVRDYGHTLRRYYAHEAHTRSYIDQRMEQLSGLVNARLNEARSWKVKSWGSGGNFRKDHTGIIRLETVFKEVGTSTQFRVSLDFGPEQRLNLCYYLTTYHTEPHFEVLGDALLAAKEDFVECEPFELFGYWANRKGFHIKKAIAQDDLAAFLRGDDSKTEDVADSIATLLRIVEESLASY